MELSRLLIEQIDFYPEAALGIDPPSSTGASDGDKTIFREKGKEMKHGLRNLATRRRLTMRSG